MNSPISRLISFFGTQDQTAKAMGVSQPTVAGWASGKHGVSELNALKAERITKGKIKASELCPRLVGLDAA